MPDPSIKDENYREHGERDYNVQVHQYKRNLDMFEKAGYVLYPPTRAMYTYIRDYCIDFVRNHPQFPKFNWKPKICDVGCGGGYGSYILSHEAEFVWGIDVSERSIKFAKEAFERHKNNIYYSPQLTFDVVDIKDEPRELMAFDIVVCIEVIEHIADYEKTLEFLKRLAKKHRKTGETLEPPESTKFFISSPNRNFVRMGKEKPVNSLHVREWTAGELYDILIKHFKYVTLMNHHGEPRDLDMVEPISFFMCETPL